MRLLIPIIFLTIISQVLFLKSLAYCADDQARYVKFRDLHLQLVEEARNAELVEESKKAEEKRKAISEGTLSNSENALSASEDSQNKKIVEGLINRQKAEEEKESTLFEERRIAEEKIKFNSDKMLADAKMAIKASNDIEAKRILDDLMKRHPNPKEHKEAALLLKNVESRIALAEKKRKKDEEESVKVNVSTPKSKPSAEAFTLSQCSALMQNGAQKAKYCLDELKTVHNPLSCDEERLIAMTPTQFDSCKRIYLLTNREKLDLSKEQRKDLFNFEIYRDEYLRDLRLIQKIYY